MSNDLQVIADTVMSAQPFFEAIDTSEERTANFNREAGFAIQIITASSYLRGVALQHKQSVVDSVTNVAAIGLSLNPAKKQAYLVPRASRKGEQVKVCLDISYIGLLDLAIMSGSIRWGSAELVHQNDVFKLAGFDAPPVHERDPFATQETRGDVIGAYVVVKTRDGDFLTTPMSIAEILDIRDRSEAWKAKAAGKSTHAGPWESDFGEMAKKTVIKRAYKLWPKTTRLDTAIHHLNTEAGEGLPAIENYQDRPESRGSRTLARLDKPINQGGVGHARAKILRATAAACIQKFNEGNEIDAYGEACGITDPEEQEILWAILAPHSTLRSTIKRMAQEEAAAEEKLRKDQQALVDASAEEAAS